MVPISCQSRGEWQLITRRPAPVCRNPRTDCSARVTQTWGIRLTHLSPGHVHYTSPNLQEPTVGTLTTPQRVLPIDGRCHENQIGAQKAFHQGKRDGGSFINHNKFSLAQFHSICRMYILWERKSMSLAWSPNVNSCDHWWGIMQAANFPPPFPFLLPLIPAFYFSLAGQKWHGLGVRP